MKKLFIWMLLLQLYYFRLLSSMILVSLSQTLFSRRGIITFSISAPLEKWSGRVYRVYGVFTFMNVLIIRLSLWPHALKRWFFKLRDEMEFGEVVYG